MAGSLTAAAPKWGCKNINWRRVFKYQSYGALVVLLAAAVLTGVSHYIVEPRVRPLKIYDAAVSLPHKARDTVPMWVAALLPFVALVATQLAVEFGVMFRRQSVTAAVHALLHVFFMAVVGFAVVLAVTESTKPVASRFRPDYMDRCKPASEPVADPTQSTALLGSGYEVRCTGRDAEAIGDGRKSFPSGHSSNSLSVCWYCWLYLVHALYYRSGYTYMGGLWAPVTSTGRRVLLELLQGLFIVWGCVVLCIAWWIGVSRYTDHRHNIDDILGGFVIALLWMTPIALISIGQLNFYQQRLAKEEGAEDAVLPVASAGPASGASRNSVAAAAAGAEAVAGGGEEEGPFRWYDAKSSVGQAERQQGLHAQ